MNFKKVCWALGLIFAVPAMFLAAICFPLVKAAKKFGHGYWQW